MDSTISSQRQTKESLFDFAAKSFSFLDETDAWVEKEKQRRVEIEAEMENNKREFRIKNGLWV